ncbi:ethanolamine ammonia-lyase subunit EutC [Sediminicoccus sp. KRV36]|uniref:ethanolamine ammonia-lyase subunit EutC n=1 Tax=Sediminicoccus sp. KRV36 TaxID=3133721 RepID=UPI00201034A9|nr:ethanolamine ammonia-lyase subunit EutC [Sediminicoccus rosea]UPY36703.1 ethanolamine ammonia-lyase subunit EutC [Sediminicoccus rosea]
MSAEDEAGAAPVPRQPVTRWADLRRFTQARVGIGRAGNAVPTAAHLDFQEAHAAARDAVWSALDAEALRAELGPVPVLHSEAEDRRTYLLRPDLGRRLRTADRESLPRTGGTVIIIADGLCASGVQSQSVAMVRALDAAWPVVMVQQARVAIGDDIGEAMGAEAVVVLIGERPGLSAQDSMGIYLTWQPRRGRTDAERNCISNIRPGGISTADAAAKLHWLLRGARALGATGVALKDDMTAAPLLE